MALFFNSSSLPGGACPGGRAIRGPSRAIAEQVIVFNELWLNVLPVHVPLMCHVNYWYYLCVVKLEAFTHSVVSRLKGKHVFYGEGKSGNTREVFHVCLIWQGAALGSLYLLIPESWALAGVFFKRLIFYLFVGRKVWRGGFCSGSFLAVVFFSVSLTLQKALPVLHSEPALDMGGQIVPFC